jgi:hypothetical protein
MIRRKETTMQPVPARIFVFSTFLAMLMLAFVGTAHAVPVVGLPSATGAPNAAVVAASTPVTLTVASARPVNNVLNVRQAPLATVSPDGAMIAWIQQTGRGRNAVGQLCIFTFQNAGKRCHDAPREYRGYPYQLYWSPDASTLAFTENPIELGHESDIWVMSAASGEFTNLTDDGITGSWAGRPGLVDLDYLPMWSPDGEQIYFWRVEPQGNLVYDLGLYRVPAAGGDAELVQDLTDAFPGAIPFFNMNTLSLDGVSALSPDGATLAVLVTSLGSLAPSATSLWTLDLTDEDAEPVEMITADEFQAGLPTWLSTPANAVGLSWSDESNLLVNAFSNDMHTPLQVYHAVNVADGETSLVVDFSTVESFGAMFDTTDGAIPMRFYSPWAASLAPDGTSVVMYNDLGGTAAVMQALLPPDGELPVILGSADSPNQMNGTRSSRASDGKVIMFGMLFTFEPAAE